MDPQLVWRGKDEQDLSDLVVNVPPLYIQEKVHPKALIADLIRQSKENREAEEHQIDMFADFNGLPEGADRTEFYRHDANWSNRMILGDSLQVMASLAEREGLQGKVQCIYIDPPMASNSTPTSSGPLLLARDVRDKFDHITREPEQVKAFRDTWRDGVHSYLTYLRDRLTVARDLLADSGSIFVQIGDENIHRVRALMDEVFGDENFVSLIQFRTKIPLNPIHIGNVCDFILWFGKSKESLKFRRLFQTRSVGSDTQFRSLKLESGLERAWTREELDGDKKLPLGSVPFRLTDLMLLAIPKVATSTFHLKVKIVTPRGTNSWKTTPSREWNVLREQTGSGNQEESLLTSSCFPIIH